MRFSEQWVLTSHCTSVWCCEVQNSVTNVLEEPDMYFQVQSRRDSSILNMDAARSSQTLVPLWLLCLTPQKTVISTALCLQYVQLGERFKCYIQSAIVKILLSF